MAKQSSKNPARVISSKKVLTGRGFTVFFEEVEEPGAGKVIRHIVRHPGSVVILAIDMTGAETRVLLERQYRHAAKRRLWELPAGSLEPGEQKLRAAKRELQEETGYTAQKWRRALFFFVSPGFFDESMTVFLAQELRKGIANPEKDEHIAVRFFPVAKTLEMVMSGKIVDVKTIVSILWLAQKRSRGGTPGGGKKSRLRQL